MNTTEIQTTSRKIGSALDRDGIDARGLALPSGLIFAEQATSALRRYLLEEGLSGYLVFGGHHDDLHDVDRHLSRLDPDARWIGQDILTGDCDGVDWLSLGNPSQSQPSGLLAFSKYKLVIVRRYWLDHESDWRTFLLCAAASPVEYDRFRNDLRAHRSEHGARVWQVVSGAPYQDGDRMARAPDMARQPLLPAEVLRRIDCDVIGFFSDEVAALYRSMNVPYRRGVLLFGPPGNGKTSTIRYAGAMLQKVSGLILRPRAGFDSDDLETVINRWKKLVPAVLVIEDLNWLLKEVNLSNFLNLLDGVDSNTATGGLLLLATTNYPEQLDPAINSRPGRFDVVIEVPPPDRELRRKFLETALDGVSGGKLERIAEASKEMSFAHLQEIVRLAGLLAIRAGRKERSEADLDEALASVRKGIEQADRGFLREPEVPFGLTPRKDQKE